MHIATKTARLVSAAGTDNATLAQAGPVHVRKIIGYNAAAALRYLKLYNKATAPTVGTDTPVFTIPLLPSSEFDYDLIGHYFSLGLGYGLVTGSADNSTSAVTAADIIGLTIAYY